MSDAFDTLNDAQDKNNDAKVESSFSTGTAKKGGRPPKSAFEKRNSKITVYLSTEELDLIQKHCESIGVQPAVFLRTQAINNVKN
tara:strand:- start:2099 stop:2353 length:255 start_codon:yes stop_codon:yes gene_type:complete